MLNCESAVERDRWMSAISKTAMEVPQVTNEGGFGGLNLCPPLNLYSSFDNNLNSKIISKTEHN